MADKKQVVLTKPMTWGGVNYAPGSNEMPEAAAAYAVRRQFGKIAGAKVSAGEKANEEKTENEKETENEKVTGLPEDFPMRHIFDGLGFKSVEEVQAKSRDELIALDGVGEKTADKALAYGK